MRQEEFAKDTAFCSVVIPVYKSVDSLAELARQINELQSEHDYSFEIIFVNDSPFYKPTRDTLSELERAYQNVKLRS